MGGDSESASKNTLNQTTHILVSRCDPHGRFTIVVPFIVLTIQGEPRTRARRVIQRMTTIYPQGLNITQVGAIVNRLPRYVRATSHHFAASHFEETSRSNISKYQE